MKELIGVCPIYFVHAAVSLVIVVGDLGRASLQVIGNVEFIILGAERNEADAGSPVLSSFDPHDQSPESDIAGLGAGGIYRGAGVVDEAAADAGLHGKILVGEAGEGGGVVIDKEPVGPVSDAGVGQSRGTVIKIILQVSYPHLRIRGKVSLGHYPERRHREQ